MFVIWKIRFTFDFTNVIEYMKLSQKALEIIRVKTLYPHLAIALNVSVGSIYRYVSSNDDSLTKAAALKVIREQSGLTDKQILVEENELVG